MRQLRVPEKMWIRHRRTGLDRLCFPRRFGADRINSCTWQKNARHPTEATNDAPRRLAAAGVRRRSPGRYRFARGCRRSPAKGFDRCSGYALRLRSSPSRQDRLSVCGPSVRSRSSRRRASRSGCRPSTITFQIRKTSRWFALSRPSIRLHPRLARRAGPAARRIGRPALPSSNPLRLEQGQSGPSAARFPPPFERRPTVKPRPRRRCDPGSTSAPATICRSRCSS